MKRCIGIIPDGNRRWAKKNNLSERQAYEAGMEKLLEVSVWAQDAGFSDIVAFCFSSNNWKRGESVLEKIFSTRMTDICFDKKKIQHTKISVIGDTANVSPRILSDLEKVVDSTKENTGIKLHALLSYDSREDIVKSIKKIQQIGKEVSEESINLYLSTALIPNPECVIRTGGHHRLSGFMLWEAEYSEIYFSDYLWPEFEKKDFEMFVEKLNRTKKNIGA